MKQRRRWLIALSILLVTSAVAVGATQLWHMSGVQGVITGNGSALADATVTLKATDFQTKTDAQGRFSLSFPRRFNAHVSAWADGYYIGGAILWPWSRSVSVDLKPYSTTDNPEYQWLPPIVANRSKIQNALIDFSLPAAARLSFNRAFLPLASKFELGCADCHGSAIYGQYAASTHSLGTSNIRFMTVYNGTDVEGNKSPETRYGSSRDYGSFPVQPSQSEPWYGPGFKLDFPDQAGNCAACHTPAQAANSPLGTDVNSIPNEAVQGTNCDFCHKIKSVELDPATGLPYENLPGVMSINLLRPSETQVFFGPLSDVDVGPDTYSPLQNESAYCAPCHNASFWGTPIYQSYAEWLASPYPQEGKTCQTCHMPLDAAIDNFAPNHGGLTRDARQIFAHNFPGAADVTLLQNTLKLEVDGSRSGDLVTVTVRVTNENAGHDVPTDHPMRNMILLVSATDVEGNELAYTGNQMVPDWGGTGNEPDDYAGLPGKGFAKILQETWTEVSPTVAYWRQTTILEDTRLAARSTDTSEYTFRSPSGAASIAAKVVFRREFKELARVKGWDMQEIEMAHQAITIP